MKRPWTFGELWLFRHRDSPLWNISVFSEARFNALGNLGLFLNASAVLRINTTAQDRQEGLTIPGTGVVTVDLPSQAFSVLVDGVILGRSGGADWFRLQGRFGMELGMS